MARLVAGHDAALNELMGRHAEKLFHYLVRSLQNEEDAADLAQETFVRVYQNRAKFDASHKFSTWLYVIATNLVKSRYRYRTRHPQVSLDAENETTGESFRESMPENNPTPSESLQGAERAEAVRHGREGGRSEQAELLLRTAERIGARALQLVEQDRRHVREVAVVEAVARAVLDQHRHATVGHEQQRVRAGLHGASAAAAGPGVARAGAGAGRRKRRQQAQRREEEGPSRGRRRHQG